MDKTDVRELVKAITQLDKTLGSVQKTMDAQNKTLDKMNNTFLTLIDKLGTLGQIMQNK